MKLISANKLNRLWNNGVVAKMVAKTKILKTLEEIEANTNVENVAGATALKEVNNKLNSMFTIVDAFNPSNIDTYTKIPYPDGFSVNNTIIIGIMGVNLDTNNYYSNSRVSVMEPTSTSNRLKICVPESNVELHNDGIYIWCGTYMESRKIKLILMKY